MIKAVNIRKLWYFAVIVFVFLVSAGMIYTANNEIRELPVLMYHSVLKDNNCTGKYVVTPQSFEEDLKYLTERGYKSVSAKDVIGFTKGENTLPEKPYLITFDDGSYNNLTYVLPLLEKYDAFAVFCIVGSYSEKFSELDEANPAYSYLRWYDISKLKESGRVEIANHSYNLHSYDHNRMGAKIKKNEDVSHYCRIFNEDTLITHKLLLDNCGIDTCIYAYPYGAYCKESEAILSDNGYIMTLTCNEGINKIGQDTDDLRLLKRFNRSGIVSTNDFFAKCKIN